MPMVSDQDYQRALSDRQIVQMIEPIYNSNELGPDARALLKKAYPNMQIEGYDLKQELKGEIEKVRGEVRQTEQQRKEAEEREKFLQTRKKTQEQHRFTDDAMERLEKLMVERNIGDYEAGALLLAAKEPKPIESTPSRYWDHEKQDNFAEISKDPEKWGFSQILGAAQRDAQRARNQGF